MAVQKILSQQIANTGGVAGQVLVANSTGVTWGDANNATNLGGVAAANYQTTAGLSANVATLTSNNTSFVGSVSAANVVSNAQLSSNLSSYQTTAGMSSYALLSGAAFTGNVSISGNLIVTGTTVTVNATTLDVKDINITVAKGAATAASADGAGITVDTANIGWYYNNASNTWQSNVGITPSANVTYNLGSAGLYWSNVYSNNVYLAGTVNAASHTVGTNFIANSTQLTISTPVSANGGVGTAGQVLTTNGATGSPYWAAAAAGVNVAAQYAWTNTQSFSAVVTHTANVSVNGAIIANSTSGTAGQVLTSTGAGNVYWSTVSGGGGFTNGQSISVANLAITGSVTANGSTGAAGQTLVSNGAGVSWSSLVPSYNYSAQFNGSSSLTLPGSTALTFGTGDFTIEFWFKTTATLQYTSFISNESGGTGYTLLLNTVTNDGKFVLYDSTLGSPLFTTSTGGYNDNNWHHFALVRIGTAFSMYVDGVSRASATSSGTIAGGTNTIYIGNSTLAGRGYNGFISNWRMVKGVGVYTGAFTVPTSPLQTTQAAGTNIAAITGTQTSLLTCSALSLTDLSSFTNVITNNGSVVASATSNPPFTYSSVSIPTTSLTSLRQSFTGDGSTTVFIVSGGYTANAISVFLNGVMLRNGTEVTVTNGSTVVFASAPPSGALIDVIGTVPTTFTTFATSGFGAYFNGSSNITVAANAALSFGTGDFTIETWVYPTAAITGNEFVYGYRSGSDTSPYLMLNPTYGVIFGGDVTDLLRSSIVPVLNTWTHIAVTRSGTSLKMFMNGAQVVSATNSTNFSDASIRYIGAGASLQYPCIGYISNLRVVKGTAVYTSAFTTPTSPLTAISGTSLLTLNSSTIVDNGPNALSLTNNGGVTVSSTVAPVFTTYTINGGTSTVNISDTFVSVFLLGL